MVTEQIVRDAFYKASEDRKKKPVVVEFENNLNDNCKLIADVINSGKTGKYVKYIQLKRKNANGKWRDIDAPTFFTLVMQHARDAARLDNTRQASLYGKGDRHCA